MNRLSQEYHSEITHTNPYIKKCLWMNSHEYIRIPKKIDLENHTHANHSRDMLMYIRTICLGIPFFSNIILLTSSASKENESYIKIHIFIGVLDVCLYYKNNKSFSSLIFFLV